MYYISKTFPCLQHCVLSTDLLLEEGNSSFVAVKVSARA